MKKIIGIIGGMGPLATADLFEKIIRATAAARDQDFPHVIVDCNTDIPDRTAAILMGGEDPVPQLVRSANTLAAAGADVLIMPCNTAHWFYDDLCLRTHLPVLHMLRLTADRLEWAGVNAVGLWPPTEPFKPAFMKTSSPVVAYGSSSPMLPVSAGSCPPSTMASRPET